MTKRKIKKVLEEKGFSVTNDGDNWFISRYTPAGEDWGLYFRELEDIIDYAEDYDPEDDFNMWIEARKRDKTVPEPAELWQDQLWKQEILNEIVEEVV